MSSDHIRNRLVDIILACREGLGFHRDSFIVGKSVYYGPGAIYMRFVYKGSEYLLKVSQVTNGPYHGQE